MYLFLSRVLLHKINLVNITSKLTWPLRKTQIFSKVILPSCSLSSQTRSFNDFVKHGGDQFQSEVTPSSSQNVTLIHKKTKKEAFILNKKHSWIKVTIWLEDGVTSLRYWSPPRFTKLIDGLRYKVTFIKASGERITAKGKEGDSLLDVIVNNDLDFDGFGACEGTLTCSTCHCILKQEDYDRLPEKPSDEELDMLDLAYELTDTSRLGCQVQLSKEFDDLEVKIPTTVNDARS